MLESDGNLLELLEMCLRNSAINRIKTGYSEECIP